MSVLTIPPEYTRALEEVLGITLSKDALNQRETKNRVRRIAEHVAQISEGLTLDRDEFVRSAYLRDEEQQQAYLLYYTTTNLLKIWPPLRELARSGFFEEHSEIRHLDIGTGTGAAVWGLATYLGQEQPTVRTLSTRATDKLPKNLKLVERFATAFKSIPKLVLSTSQLDLTELFEPNESLSDHPPKHDLITMMNVLAEIDETHDEKIAKYVDVSLAEGGAIIMIEPASRELSRRALRFRNRMVVAGWHVYSPCCKSGGCPALDEKDNWCHTEIAWERPEFIRAIDDEIGTLRLSLKCTYAVFVRQDLNLSDTLLGRRDFQAAGRVVSELFDEKGRYRAFICNEAGRREFVMNKRDKSSSNRDIAKLKRYDLVQIDGIEPREHDVKVGSGSRVYRMSDSEGCVNVDNLSKD